MPKKQVAAIYNRTIADGKWILNDNGIFVKKDSPEEDHQITIWEYYAENKL